MLNPSPRHSEALTAQRGSQAVVPPRTSLLRRLWLLLIAPFITVAQLFSTLYKGGIGYGCIYGAVLSIVKRPLLLIACPRTDVDLLCLVM